MSFRRLRTLIQREIRATFRDLFTMSILVATPLGSMLIFSFVLSTEVSGLRLAVLDVDGSVESRQLIADVAAEGSFLPQVVGSREDITRGMRSGEVSAALIIPPGFGRDVQEGRAPTLQAIYDGAEAVLAGNAEGALGGLLAASGGRLRGTGPPSGVAVATQVLFNPRLDGTPFMVSGTFGFVLSFLTTLITAVTIVNERQAGTFDQLQVTPATSLEILLGKLLPLGFVFSIDVVLMVILAGIVLGVWPNGSAVFFVVVSAFYVMVSLSLGLIFSATSQTAAEAVQKTVLFSVPLVQLSGFAFPIRNMPMGLQWITELFPATHYIRVTRAIYLRGEGPIDLAPELLVLSLFAAALVFMALRTLETRA